MAEPLKVFFSRTLIRRLATEITRVHPPFPARRFTRAAQTGLDDLELLDRARHIMRALASHLPASYPDAIDILLRSLGPEHDGDESLGLGMAPFFYLPHGMFIAENGLEHFDLSMNAQRELTKRMSAEFAIRPYIAKDPERVFNFLRAWARDPNPHVRRLVSEGTRPRLPWAQRVAWLDQNPGRIVELLELLKDDPSTMVRRSVANSLNDLARLRPDLLIRTARAWLDGSIERRRLVEHGLRGAVKSGNAEALALLGYGGRPAVVLEEVTFTPRRVRIGGRAEMRFTLRSTSREPQDLLIDARVHFVKANGATAAKVFKVTRAGLPARGRLELRTSFSLAVHTTRQPYPGEHAVDVLVNGRGLPAGSFRVSP